MQIVIEFDDFNNEIRGADVLTKKIKINTNKRQVENSADCKIIGAFAIQNRANLIFENNTFKKNDVLKLFDYVKNLGGQNSFSMDKFKQHESNLLAIESKDIKQRTDSDTVNLYQAKTVSSADLS